MSKPPGETSRGGKSLPRTFRIFLLLLGATLFLGSLFPAWTLTPSQRALKEAKRELARLAASPHRRRYRRYWIWVINRFRRVYLRYPESPEAPKALIWTARLYRNLYGYSHRRGDLEEALQHYRMLWEHYPRSALADDALAEAADLSRDLLKKPEKASSLLQILCQRYPQGDQAWKYCGSHAVPSPKRSPSSVGPSSSSGTALVKNIRHWSGEDYSRVVVDVSAPVRFQDHALKAQAGRPPRVYVDLTPARLSPYLKPEIPIRDGLLTRVRLGQYRPATVRVVL
ncbi:MAG: hypothetical protein DSZ24_02605, partial [Thermodesulfatator sp.]